MTGDPLVREIGRITDGQGRVLIISADHAAVTMRTLHTRTNGAVTLGRADQEELALMLTAAVWQAGWQRMKIDADTDAADTGTAGAQMSDREECGCGPDDMCATCAPSDEEFAKAIMAALSAEIRDQDAGAP